MSKAFERRLADRTVEYFKRNSPEPGERFVGQFYDSEIVDNVSTAVIEAGGGESVDLTLGEKVATVPALFLAEAPTVIPVRVRPNSWTEPLGFHEVTQAFASRLRDYASSPTSDEEIAVLLFYERDQEIDTLRSARPTPMYSDDGVLPLRRVWDEVLSASESLASAANALLLALRDELGEYRSKKRDIEQLRRLCTLREAIETGEYTKVPDLIPKLGTYLKEDTFDADWFARGDSQDALREVAKTRLQRNHTHAERIQDSKAVGTIPQRALSGQYDDEFIEFVDKHERHTIPHTKANRHEIEQPPRPDPDPKFDSFDVTADSWESCNVHPASQGIDTHRGILAVSSEGSLTLTVEFDRTIEDPYQFGTESIDGSAEFDVAVTDSTITVDISALSPSGTHYLSFEVYVNSSTRRGNPTCRFDIGVIPEWFDTARQNLNLKVSFNEGALVAPQGISPILYHADDEEPTTIEVTDEEYDLHFDDTVELKPAYAGDDRIQCTVHPDHGGDPVTLYIRPDPPDIDLSDNTNGEDDGQIDLSNFSSDVVLPLQLNAIGDPQIWSRNSEELLVDEGLGYDPDEGEFQTTAAEGIAINSRQHDLLQIEAEIRDDKSVAPRTITREPLGPDLSVSDQSSVPESIATAYDELFEHLAERDRVLSTDSWDDETLALVEKILETYLQELNSVDSVVYDDYAVFRNLGAISIRGVDKHWLTPYHPLMLAYGYKIASWRDRELVPQGLIAGFKEHASYNMFSPIGLFPYRYGSSGDTLLSGQMLEKSHLWCKYSGATTTTSDTPEYIDQDLAKKLSAFTETFDTLVQLHPDRPININLFNMGDLEPVLRGLYQYYRHIKDEEFIPPRILLRVFGPSGQGEQLERFFDGDSESEIRDSISNQETLDTMLRRVSYVRSNGGDELEERDAHLTFFRKILEPDRVSRSTSELGSSFRLDGLIPQEARSVEYREDETIASSGYADDTNDSQLLAQVARHINALEPVADNEEFTPGTAFRQQIRSEGGAIRLREIWDESIWVSHVEPPVDLDFYITPHASDAVGDQEGEPAADERSLMIHYSDQYDPSSPGFDVITTTNKQELYVGALSEALENSGALARVSPDSVLQHLVAIDGSFALEIQQAEGKNQAELIGMIGSLGISKTLLSRFKPAYVWFPISLREIAQQDYAQQTGRGSGFQFETSGRASDDLCYVGLPATSEGEFAIKLWLVEAKGGKANPKGGVEQIKGAYEEFMSKLHPDKPLADTTLRRAELGQLISNIGRRLAHYGVYEDAYEQIQQYERHLKNGEYDVSFLRDEAGHVGDVISVDPERDKASIESYSHARVLKLPSPVIELLSEESRPIEDILEFIDVSDFEFGEEGELPAIEDDTDAEEQEGAQIDSDEATDNRSRDADTDDDAAANIEQDSERADVMSEDEAEQPDDASETEDSDADDAQTAGEVTAEQLDEIEYDWTQDQLKQVLTALSESPAGEIEFEVDRLTAELRSQFKSLGVDIHKPDPSSVTVGPRKVSVNVKPESGQRINGILNNLDSLGVHIQAQGSISGITDSSEGAVRLEIPHGQPQPVHLRSGLEETFDQLMEGLSFPVGVNTQLKHYTLDLLNERHMLVGGTTGSGKSNFLTAVMLSLALTRSPADLKLTILDPKGVDFTALADLPHVHEDGYIDNGNQGAEYLMDVVTSEIENRQAVLKQSPARTIQEYNELADQIEEDKIPYHVIVIDEFADLILALDDRQDEFIDAVQRLTQTGRAFGISLVIATQRPSANIVPGAIKANLPCRISFELPSNTDSRVILDRPGAEDLEGAGDMIALPAAGDELHLQGYLVPPADMLTIIELLS